MNPSIIRIRILRIISAILLASACHAESPSDAILKEIWTTVLQHVHSGKLLVASQIKTHIDVYDGDGKYMGSTDSVKGLAGWDKNKPIRKEISSKTEGKPGMTMEMSFGFENHPEAALDDLPYQTMKAPADLEGKSVIVIAAEDKPGKKQVKATLYIDPETKRPLKIDYVLPMDTTFGSGMCQLSVVYKTIGAGKWLPSKVAIDQSGRYLFWKRRLVIRQEFIEWAQCP